MAKLIHYLVRYGVSLVFLNVFAEQIGAPVPAVPTLIVAGALARNGQMSSTHVLLVAVIASLIADWIWFLLGRRYGYSILRTLCRISLSPDSCVRDTEARFERWGMKSLLFAKFIPGFSTVAPPLAGAGRKRSTLAFLIYDGIGALLWAGSAVATGRLFHRQIGVVIDKLENLGWWAIAIVGSLLALFVLAKWWQRRRFLEQLRIARVSVGELKAMIERDEQPVVLDVRTRSSQQRNPHRIPTALVTSADEIDNTIEAISPDREIVLYCT
jgi:membrane protein DedA with SNARE-associated domain